MADPSDHAASFPKPGEIIAGKYEVEAHLGAGAMGVVVAARHRLLGQKVAIKLILPGRVGRRDALVRFTREARAIAALESEYIVRILDFGMLEDETPYMVMQHLTGRDLLSELRARGGKLPVTETVDLMIQACAGLADAHAQGIVHRDVKPGNLFITRRTNGEPLLKILDFGISKTPKEMEHELSLTDTQATLGSPLYMSPEQIRQAKTVDHRSDIWSLGIVLHHMLVGKSPFNAEGISGFLAAVVADSPMPLRAVAPEMPEELERIVLRCLEKPPGFRFSTVVDLARALAPFASPRARALVDHITPVEAPPVAHIRVPAHAESSVSPAAVTIGNDTAAPSVVELRPRTRRRWWLVGALVGGACVAAAVATVSIRTLSVGAAASARAEPPSVFSALPASVASVVSAGASSAREGSNPPETPPSPSANTAPIESTAPVAAVIPKPAAQARPKPPLRPAAPRHTGQIVPPSSPPKPTSPDPLNVHN